MKNILYNPNKKAFVLSLVLWITAAMMLLSLLFVRMTKEETNIYKKMHHKLYLEIATQSLFEKLGFYIATGTFTNTAIKGNLEGLPKQIQLDAKEYNTTVEDTYCTYKLLDHSSMFSLYTLRNKKQAQNLIQTISQSTYPFVDIYSDWKDPDDFTRLNGAEKSDYLLDGYGYVPTNFNSFLHVGAMTLLKDFYMIDKNSTDEILKYFTTYRTSSINIKLIDETILRSFFPNLEKEEIKELIKLRKNNFEAYRQMFATISYENYDVYPSKVITFNITCKNKDIASKLKAVVDFELTNDTSWTIIEINKK